MLAIKQMDSDNVNPPLSCKCLRAVRLGKYKDASPLAFGQSQRLCFSGFLPTRRGWVAPRQPISCLGAGVLREQLSLSVGARLLLFFLSAEWHCSLILRGHSFFLALLVVYCLVGCTAVNPNDSCVPMEVQLLFTMSAELDSSETPRASATTAGDF